MTDHGLNNPRGEAGARERSLFGAPQGSPTEKGPGDEPNKDKGKRGWDRQRESGVTKDDVSRWSSMDFLLLRESFSEEVSSLSVSLRVRECR